MEGQRHSKSNMTLVGFFVSKCGVLWHILKIAGNHWVMINYGNFGGSQSLDSPIYMPHESASGHLVVCAGFGSGWNTVLAYWMRDIKGHNDTASIRQSSDGGLPRRHKPSQKQAVESERKPDRIAINHQPGDDSTYWNQFFKLWLLVQSQVKFVSSLDHCRVQVSECNEA